MIAISIAALLLSAGMWLMRVLWLRKRFDPQDIALRSADLYFRAIPPSRNSRRPKNDV